MDPLLKRRVLVLDLLTGVEESLRRRSSRHIDAHLPLEHLLELSRPRLLVVLKHLPCLVLHPRQFDLRVVERTARVPRPLGCMEDAIASPPRREDKLAGVVSADKLDARFIASFCFHPLVVDGVHVNRPLDRLLLVQEGLGWNRDVLGG